MALIKEYKSNPKIDAEKITDASFDALLTHRRAFASGERAVVS
jgi:hypothetical protein